MSSSASSCSCRSSGSGSTCPEPSHALQHRPSDSPVPSHSQQVRLSPERIYSRIFSSRNSSGSSSQSRLNAYFISVAGYYRARLFGFPFLLLAQFHKINETFFDPVDLFFSRFLVKPPLPYFDQFESPRQPFAQNFGRYLGFAFFGEHFLKQVVGCVRIAAISFPEISGVAVYDGEAGNLRLFFFGRLVFPARINVYSHKV